MYYINKVHDNSCEVVDTTDGVHETLSKDYILGCMQEGVKVHGYSNKCGFYPVVPISEGECVYLGTLNTSTAYKSIVVPSSRWAKDLYRIGGYAPHSFTHGFLYENRADNVSGNLDVDIYTAEFSKKKCKFDFLKVRGEFVGLVSPTRFLIKIDGEIQEVDNYMVGIALPLDAYNMRFCELKDEVRTIASEAKKLFNSGTVSNKLTAEQFADYFSRDSHNSWSKVPIEVTEYGVAISPNTLCEFLHKVFLGTRFVRPAMMNKTKGADETTSALLRLASDCYRVSFARNKPMELVRNTALLFANSDAACTHISIEDNTPMLHYVRGGGSRIEKVNLIEFLQGNYSSGLTRELTLDIPCKRVSRNCNCWRIHSLMGTYTLDLDVLLEVYGGVPTAETISLSARAKLAGYGNCKITGNGTLEHFDIGNSSSIIIPRGVKRIGVKSIKASNVVEYVEFPDTVVSVAPQFTDFSTILKIGFPKFKLVFRGDSISTCSNVISTFFGLTYVISVQVMRKELATLGNFDLRKSNMETVLTALLREKDAYYILANTQEDEIKQSGIDTDAFTTAFYKSVLSVCSRVLSGEVKLSLSKSTLTTALRDYKSKGDSLIFPKRIEQLVVINSPVKTSYAKFDRCKYLYFKWHRVFSGSAKDALDAYFTEMEQKFSDYMIKYKEYLIGKAIYSDIGNLQMISVVRYLKQFKEEK